MQCLTEALGVDVNDADQTTRLKVDQPLQDLFDKAYPPRPAKKVATKDEEAKANDLKDEGWCWGIFRQLVTRKSQA